MGGFLVPFMMVMAVFAVAVLIVPKLVYELRDGRKRRQRRKARLARRAEEAGLAKGGE